MLTCMVTGHGIRNAGVGRPAAGCINKKYTLFFGWPLLNSTDAPASGSEAGVSQSAMSREKTVYTV